MWRSFFLAVGIGLMLLGAEALVFERAVINSSARLPNFLNGLFENNGQDNFAFARNVPVQANPAFQTPNASAPNFQRTPYTASAASSDSRFGPSRFSGPQAGNYGGPRVDLSRSGFSSNNAQRGNVQPANAFPVAFSNRPNSAPGFFAGSPNQIRGPRTIVTKDWMPWSLLAAGGLTFLYTTSHGRARGDY